MATESATTAATILIVDDEPMNVDLLEQELAAAGYRTLSAVCGDDALAKAARTLPDLILLDVMMEGLDGYSVCEQLKASVATRAIPVIFLTALTDTFEKVRAFSVGAVDYVSKPFETEELLARVSTHIALRREIEAHRRSKSTIQYMVEEIRSDRDAMVGDSLPMRRVIEQIAQVAPTDSTVLIQGETGTGKELVARAIHEQSARRDRPLIKLNCAALPRDLVESELFGHEKGAFTGATQQRRGRFELADGGTLFLDEAGELPLETQAKLLRVLQEREFDRVGGTRSLRTNVRVIAATNRDLQARVASGEFRADLYYRLNVFPIMAPPLRERRDDIPDLVRHFAAKAARKLVRTLDGVSPAFIERAGAHEWPGNIRDLENIVERAIIMSNSPVLDAPDFFSPPAQSESALAVISGNATLEEIERTHIKRVLEHSRWEIDRDVIRGRRFDVTKKFLPDGLCRVGKLDFLSVEEKRLVSRIQGRTYANMFGLVERFIGVKVLEISREHMLGDQIAFEALVRFTDEELKHQELFRRIEQLVAADMPAGYTFLPQPNDVATAVLGKCTWAVLALTCHIELFTQAHYRQSIEPDSDLSDLWKDVFLFHWKEESQHAILDELEWKREDAKLTPAQRDQAVSDLIDLVAAVHGILQMQAAADTDYFLTVCGRAFQIDQVTAVRDAMLAAYRWQYIISGVQDERFSKILGAMITDVQMRRIGTALAPIVN